MKSRRTFLQLAGAALAVSAVSGAFFGQSSILGQQAFAEPARQATQYKAAKRTLVLVSHPYFDSSTLIKGLQQAAERVDGVTIRNLDQIYGKDVGGINVAEETRLMHEHDRIVFVFPTHWFNITPMMKAWLNDVWGSVGPDRWKGKEMLIVTTAAGGSSTYGKNGRIGVPLADVFLPMKATALHCGMTYLPPLAFERASSARLAEYQQVLMERLIK